MKLYENFSLKLYNTFGFNVMARYYGVCRTKDEVREMIQKLGHLPILVKGGGSNLLFTSDFKGAVLAPDIRDLDVVAEDDATVTLRVGAGVVWDDFVAYCVSNGYSGVENLSYIPGNVGAAPIQNIGAYGVEVGGCIVSVAGVMIDSKEDFLFYGDQCQFGYRQSIFKNEYRNRCVITHVVFSLKKQFNPVLSYGHVLSEVEKLGSVSLENIRRAIIAIRQSKLPDPHVIGNAGSFFKNPEVSASVAEGIKAQYPDVVLYPLADGRVKLPAGWLIEKSGWKGFRTGHVGVHDKQALVLVHYGGGNGTEIVNLAQTICNSVNEKFGVQLDKEVNIV